MESMDKERRQKPRMFYDEFKERAFRLVLEWRQARSRDDGALTEIAAARRAPADVGELGEPGRGRTSDSDRARLRPARSGSMPTDTEFSCTNGPTETTVYPSWDSSGALLRVSEVTWSSCVVARLTPTIS